MASQGGSEGTEVIVQAQSTFIQIAPEAGSRPTRPCAAIFDFDRCIMKHHMWAKYNTAKLANIPIGDADFGDVVFFRKLVPALRGAGVHVAIATFGRQDVALKAMRQAFGEEQTFFSTKNVSTPKDFGAIEGSDSLEDKNTQLKALSELLGVSFQDMVFFDDSPCNITNAKVLGVNAISAKPFSTKIWESNSVSDWFTQRGVTLSLV